MMRTSELWALVLLGLAVIGAVVYGLSLGRISDLAIGGLLATLPVIVNAISRLSTSAVMNEMAKQLGGSTPVVEAAPPNGEAVP